VEVTGGLGSRLSVQQLQTLDTMRAAGLITSDQVATIRARAATR
jgi:hypothetical protein